MSSGIFMAILALASGAFVGLSAPGFNQWYIAWFGLIPLFLLAVSRKGPGQAFWIGLGFGTAYNLVCLNWYLELHPLTWLGFSVCQSTLLAGFSWLFVSLHQGIIIGLFAFLLKAMPLTAGFIPSKVGRYWLLPSAIMVPCLWILLENKLGNAHELLGVPWTMLEYSQYQQLNLLQAASWIGGIGVGYVLVSFNVTLAELVATFYHKSCWKPFAHQSTAHAAYQMAIVALMVGCLCAWGSLQLLSFKTKPFVTMSVVQANINIEMQKSKHRYTLDELLARYEEMTHALSKGICIWPENSLPVYLASSLNTQAVLSQLSNKQEIDMIVGSLDRDTKGQPFNSVFGITGNGTLLPCVYHKRYLVPFGEYTPRFVKYLPEWVQRFANTPAGTGFCSGDQPVVLRLPSGSIAPLICFETLSPELVTQSVRAGGELLVNLSDLAWFHNSMIGQQMIAFSILRAIENRRYFVFAANSGPSAIIEPTGKVIAASPKSSKATLTARVGFSSTITPFTYWFH